jgi:hypothetical protein
MRRNGSGEREFLHPACRDAPGRTASPELAGMYDDVLVSLKVSEDWDPGIDVTSLRSNILVSATDVAGAGKDACLRHLAFKGRPGVKLRAWSRSFQNGGSPFPLGNILDLVLDAHEDPACASYDGQKAWLDRQLSAALVHRLTLPFVRHAVESILEAHESLEEEVGPLRLLVRDPVTGTPSHQLTAWGPLYANAAGTEQVREMRRVRLGSAHQHLSDADRRWVAAAAMVAALAPSPEEPERVRVVEVGAADESVHVCFDGDLAEVRAQYRQLAVPALKSILGGQDAKPGWSCGGCKVAGGCDGLLQVTGALGQKSRGVATRSVSASGLNTYERCAARSLLQTSLHLPAEASSTAAQQRGLAVHRWLELAHADGEACVPGVIPSQRHPTEAGDICPEAELAEVALYVAQHAAICPFGRPNVSFVSVEANLHGWDDAADVILASKPDLIYRDGTDIVARETKTSMHMPRNADEALQNHLQVSFLLAQFAAGLASALTGSSCRGRVELEVLTPDAAQVFSWDATDAQEVGAAQKRLGEVVDRWHKDAQFAASPGAHCEFCPVQRWCPDVDAGASPRPVVATNIDAKSRSPRTGGACGARESDEPPF